MSENQTCFYSIKLSCLVVDADDDDDKTLFKCQDLIACV